MVEDKSNVIVVGVDGSVGSQKALAWTLKEAATRKCAVDAVLVWDDPWAVIGPPSPVTALGARGLAHLEDQLSSMVRVALNEDLRQGVVDVATVEITAKVLSGDPAKTLARESRDAEMLVVGSRGMGAVKGALVGSVSQRCAQLSHVPLVIVPTAA